MATQKEAVQASNQATFRYGLLAIAAVAVPLTLVAGEFIASAISPTQIWPQEFESLEDLARQSPTIVVASILPPVFGHASWREDLGYVEFSVKARVETSLKGSLPAGAVITVHQPGGEAEFQGTVRRSIRPADALGLRSGRPFVLFIKQLRNRSGFELVGGPQGSFEVYEGRVSLSDLRPNREAWQRLNGLPFDEFQSRVQKALK